jgi:hypothetical protein
VLYEKEMPKVRRTGYRCGFLLLSLRRRARARAYGPSPRKTKLAFGYGAAIPSSVAFESGGSVRRM